jgi:hypothetical protein
MAFRNLQDGRDDTTSTGDPMLESLCHPEFDPVDWLNEVLPNLTLSTQAQASKVGRSTQIQTTSSEVQAVLSKLNTHNIRSSSVLTSLTDEILRSGNRLAYEVEILRGDVNNFYELLTETLKEDIQQFVRDEAAPEPFTASADMGDTGSDQERTKKEDPVFITQLRMLGQVKSRLEALVAVFGEAMKWSVPPSDLSMASSLISVSAPELGIQSTEEDEKARETARIIRTEIQDLLDADGGGYAGLEAATKRVAQYRDLATVWKGTAEEKVRTRFVEGLVKQLDDRKKLLDSRGLPRRTRADNTQRSSSAQGRSGRGETSGGLFRNLAKLKDDLYLD